MQPALSVSIVLYETPAEDLRNLLPAFAQGSPAVTVVDNSPTTDLRPLVESAGVEYVWPGRNLGYGGGHNLAMWSAIQQSKYHLVCNPDIVCTPQVLAELSAFMDRNPEVGLVMPRVLFPDGDEQRLCKLLPAPADLFVRRFAGRLGTSLMRPGMERYEMRGLGLDHAREAPCLSGCFMFLRSSVLRQVGLFDPRYFMYMEDVDLCRRVGAVAHTVFYPRVSVIHGYSKGSYQFSRLLRFHIASAVRYFNKWGWLQDPERRRLNRRTASWPDAEQDTSALAASGSGRL